VAKSDEQVMEEFDEAVNMSARELEEWLQTEESREVGQKDDGNESRGHEAGRRIVEILEKDEEDIGKDDVDHMRRVVSYVHRHQAQEPEEDVQDSRWRYSSMNWSHDPLK
jgi:DNA topoisomerase VI subunit B